MAIPGFKTTTTTRSIILDAAVQLIFNYLEEEYPLYELDKLADISSGGTPSRSVSSFYGGDIPWAKIGDITEAGKWISETEEYITQSALENSSAKLFPSGTVLYSMYGSIGKTSIAKKAIATNQAILGIIPKEGIQTEYLYYALINARTRLFSQSKGTSQKNINGRMVKEFEIPLPPQPEIEKIVRLLAIVEEGEDTSTIQDIPKYLTEIRRIVARIEALAARVQEALSLREKTVEEAEKLHGSFATELFTYSKNNFQNIPVGKTFSFRNDLIRPTDGRTDDLRFIGLQHIESNTGKRIGEDPVNAQELKGRKFFFSPGEIVYGYLRPYLNKVWIADREGICSVDQYVIRPNHQFVDTQYLAYFMRSPVFLREAIELTHNLLLPRLRSGLLESIEIPIPPLNEQKHIVARLDTVQTKVDELRQLQAETQAELDALLPSILDKAFRGEL